MEGDLVLNQEQVKHTRNNPIKILEEGFRPLNANQPIGIRKDSNEFEYSPYTGSPLAYMLGQNLPYHLTCFISNITVFSF